MEKDRRKAVFLFIPETILPSDAAPGIWRDTETENNM
jgi:hypothetical protein